MRRFLIVDENLIDRRMILQEFSTERGAHQRQFFDRKSASDFGDQGQCQHQVAEKARLQNQHIVPIHREHFLDGHRLVDQHHRDVVFDRVHQPAGLTNQPVALVIEMDVTFAFGTGENVEKIFTDCHGYSLQFALQIQIPMSLA
jgi:hypothetical protein